MSTIFSPSACSWKPSNPQEKCFFHPKRRSAIKTKHQAATAVKGAVLTKRSFRRHTSVCSLVHLSKRSHAFRHFEEISLQFSQGSPVSGVPADWPPLQWDGGVPPVRLSPEKFDRSAGVRLEEIRPICADNETAWQGHNGNYFARDIVRPSN